MSSDDDIMEESLGYKRPPTWSQFQKGKSGNPKGRPKKRRSEAKEITISESAFDDTIARELGRIIKVNDVDGTNKMEAYQVAIRSLSNKAMKGDVQAQKVVIVLMRWVEERKARIRAAEEKRQAEEKEIDERVFANMVALKAERERIWAAAIANGGEPEQPWPHPDDILINVQAKRWSIVGPFRPADEPFYRYVREQRDLIFLRSEYYRRKARRRHDGPSVWDIMWLNFDVMLPRRWQLLRDRETLAGAIWIFSHFTMRQLWKDIERTDARVEQLRILANLPPPGKEEYRFANAVMKPLLNHYGYRSLAQFERAYATMGDKMPWPGRKNQLAEPDEE